LIRGIAAYEGMADQVEADEVTLERTLFDEQSAHVLLAVSDDEIVGFALYFYNFSTFKGRKGLYLEDLFVEPGHRGNGHGKRLFERLMSIAAEEHCGRMEWVCLSWNQPALDFYAGYGAKKQDAWRVLRLDESDLS
jgi:GNAT superfamily N-acetyltransferase